MKRIFVNVTCISTFAILAVMMLAPTRASGQNPGEPETTEIEMKQNIQDKAVGARSLEGVWNSTVTFRVCATGAAIRSFPSMNTFVKGGILQEFGVGSGLFRSPAHGVWQHLGEDRFYSTFQFFRFNPDGTPLDRVVARRYLQVGFLGDSFTASSTTEFRDFNGNITGTGCATEVGTRFQ